MVACTLLAHGVTAAYDVTKKLEAFGELDSFYAAGDYRSGEALGNKKLERMPPPLPGFKTGNR